MTSETVKFDLVLRNGWVIDPANNRNGPMDVAISSGRVTTVDRRIDGASGAKEIDVSGLYVTPGLIDIHAHFYGGGGGFKDFEMNPDMYALPNGTTTVVDAGGPGWMSHGGFIDGVVNASKVRVLGLLNICAYGMNTAHEKDPTSLMPEQCAATIRENSKVFVGVKTAHYSQPDYASVDAAVKAGDLASAPVMMDSWPSEIRKYPDMLLRHLRPGDIHTHFYAQQFPWLGDNGAVAPYMWEARTRGVIFDVGHGGGSFWFRIAKPAMEQGFGPDTISTDAHSGSYYIPRATMPMTMSKLICLGMPLDEAVERSTSVPASVIGRKELGTLSTGAEADIAVFELERGSFGFVDSGGARMTGEHRLTCALTVRAGKVVYDKEGVSRPDWRTLGKYGRVD